MELFNLIEKKDRLQISIIRYLLDVDMHANITDLMNHLEVTPFRFYDSLNELSLVLSHLELDLEITVRPEANSISLKKSNHTNLNMLYYYYLKQSTDYRLFTYLYQHPNYSIYELSQALSLSEASIYRCIARLNTYLEEFDIKIRGGKIYGDELQVSYFFFKLFWNSIPLNKIDALENDESSLLFIELLEKRLSQNFTATTKAKLCLWIKILKTRTKKENPIESKWVLNKICHEQINDPIYQVVRDVYFLSANHSSPCFEYKVAYLYLFVSALFILQPENNLLLDSTYWGTFNPQVIQLNENVVQAVKAKYHIDVHEVDPEFVRNWKYLLTQLHSTILFFKGNITFFDDKILFDRLREENNLSKNSSLTDSILQGTEDILGFSLPKAARTWLVSIHSYFISQMRLFSQARISIGILCNRNNFQTNIMLESIDKDFSNKFSIHSERAETGRKYDILISDSEFSTNLYSFKDLYIINDFKTQADQRALTLLLKKYTQKG